MEIYKGFAIVYDLFMDNVPYKKWVVNIENIFKKHNKKPKTILDLGCGTGKATIKLSKKGYKMIGLDISSKMLSIADNKAFIENQNILFINQNMVSFNLNKKVNAVISLCDSINYILKEKELVSVLKNVNRHLTDNGIFIFDVNTLYKYKYILKDNTFVNTKHGKAIYIWENFYNNKTQINEYTTNFFIKTKNNMYKRYTEIHYQKCYTKKEILEIAEKSGFKVIDILDIDTMKYPTSTSEKIYYVMKKEKNKNARLYTKSNN